MSSIGPLLVLGIAGLVIIALVVIIVAVIVRASTGRSRRRSGYGPDGAAPVSYTHLTLPTKA